MMLTENYHIVPVGSDINFNTGASQDTDSINMEGFHSATFLISFGTIGVANTVLTVNSGATNGAATSALTFNYAYGSATALFGGPGANADVLAAWTSVATLTILQATYSNFLLVVEIEAAAMDLANNEEWLTLRFTDAGGCTGLATVIAVLTPRYKSNVHVTALT